MSAWLVLSAALGFYSVTPGRPEYVIGTPTITAEGGAADRPYVQSATLGGRPFTRAFSRYDEIVKGGDLAFRLAPEPNRAWGTGGRR